MSPHSHEPHDCHEIFNPHLLDSTKFRVSILFRQNSRYLHACGFDWSHAFSFNRTGGPAVSFVNRRGPILGSLVAFFFVFAQIALRASFLVHSPTDGSWCSATLRVCVVVVVHAILRDSIRLLVEIMKTNVLLLSPPSLLRWRIVVSRLSRRRV